MASSSHDRELKHTPLHALHVRLGARMVPFAGYALPVQYGGIIAEHTHTRSSASLFDVSHMGQAIVTATKDVASAFERLVPGDVVDLAPGRMRYTQLTNDDGGIIDDLMVSRLPDANGLERLFAVVNGARKDIDFPHMAERLKSAVSLERLEGRALMALQGPKAVEALGRHIPGVEAMTFMSTARFSHDGADGLVSRCGYTGEDGFEISLPAEMAESFAMRLLAEPEVKPAGLGARDSLRLEAGLCLYGQDLDEATSPVEAGLAWSIGKRRREQGGFPGAKRILDELENGPSRSLVGIKPTGRAPARHGVAVEDAGGSQIGTVTSGGFGPSVGGPVALGYLAAGYAVEGGLVTLRVRGKAQEAQIVKLPFVPHRYVRKGKGK